MEQFFRMSAAVGGQYEFVLINRATEKHDIAWSIGQLALANSHWQLLQFRQWEKMAIEFPRQELLMLQCVACGHRQQPRVIL